MNTYTINGRTYTITHDPKPIPTKAYDYNFSSDDYDYAPDFTGGKAGCGADVDDCIRQINDLEDL